MQKEAVIYVNCRLLITYAYKSNFKYFSYRKFSSWSRQWCCYCCCIINEHLVPCSTAEQDSRESVGVKTLRLFGSIDFWRHRTVLSKIPQSLADVQSMFFNAGVYMCAERESSARNSWRDYMDPEWKKSRFVCRLDRLSFVIILQTTRDESTWPKGLIHKDVYIPPFSLVYWRSCIWLARGQDILAFLLLRIRWLPSTIWHVLVAFVCMKISYWNVKIRMGGRFKCLVLICRFVVKRNRL